MTCCKSKMEALDQFYTKPEIAKYCLDLLMSVLEKQSEQRLFLEPSAGNGSFYNILPKNKVGYDLDPKCQGVETADFFTINMDQFRHPLIAIGNPPFGKNSSLAIKFFNHAARAADIIAFILPKTFRKISIHEKLNRKFWLTLDVELPKKSFIFNENPHDVPCCFQIWTKKERNRNRTKKLSSEYVEFVKKTANCDFAIRRVGGKAGIAMNNWKICSENSNYFIHVKTPAFTKEFLVDTINSIDFYDIVNSTVGVRSLSKNEFIKEFNRVIKNVDKSIAR